MKIIFVGNQYDHGKPELGPSNEYSNYYEALVQMNNKENEVILFPIDVVVKRDGIEKANKGLFDLVLREKPDAVFVFNMDAVQKDIMRRITQESGAKTFTWSLDDHWNFYKCSKYWAPLFHWIFTTDPRAIAKYDKIGFKNAVFMPQGFNPFLFKAQVLPKIYDVTFIGRPHGVRKEIMKKLGDAGIRVECFGEGWSNGHITNEEKIRIICQSKINLNLAESSGVLWKQLALIFVHRNFDRSLGVNSPLKWYENFQTLLAQNREQIKGRIFHVLGCGGFLLTGYAESMEKLFEPDKEVVFFRDFNEMVKKIKYYLVHDKEREDIAKAGYERSFRDHTMEKRFNQIFKIILSGHSG
ncbi:MAG: glycosyltransferase [Patescibacteria group bacterium]